MNNLKIYISTSDNYHSCLPPFAYLFNKFWSSDLKVTFLGYKEPNVSLPSNFDFISLGEQKGPSYYGQDMRTFFESIDDEYFIYTMEDQFILDYVNVDVIDKLLPYTNNSNVGRICLTNSIFQSHMGKKHEKWCEDVGYDLVQYTQDSEFRMTCEWTIWKKDYLCRYLLDGMDPWQFESVASRESKNNGYHLIGCKNKVAIQHAEALRRRNTEQGFDFKFVNEDKYLDNNTIEDMKQRNII